MASPMASKPLPRLPLFDELPPLTPTATAHLNRILVQAFDNEKLSLQWLPHIENALVDLADAVRRGEWTGGARRKRLALSFKASGATSDSTTPAINTATSSKTTTTPTPTDDPVAIEARTIVQALASLDERIAASATPFPSSTPSHLLITLSPPEPARHFPDLGIEFDIRPHREACIFGPGTYALPFYDHEAGARRGSGGSVLTGFEEWKVISQDPALSNVRIVGGNFAFKGVHGGDDYVALTKVLRLGIYSVLSLQLELSVFRDVGIRLKYPSILPSTKPKPAETVSPPPSTTGPAPAQKPNRRAKATSGIWSFLTKRTEGFIRPLHTPSPTQLPHPTIRPPLQSPLPPQSPFSTHFPQRVSLDLVRTFSHHIRMSSSDHDVQTSPSGKNAKAAERLLRLFSNTVARINDGHSVFSTSPDISFAPPSLIIRLAEKEKKMIEASQSTSGSSGVVVATSHGKIRLTGQEKAGLTSLIGWSAHHPEQDDPAATLVGSDAFIRHQGLTVLYAEHVPSVVEPQAAELVSKRNKEKEVTGTASTISDVRTVESDSTDTTVNTSTSMSTYTSNDPEQTPPNPLRPTEIGTKTCLPARWETYRFYSRQSDLTLGELVTRTCAAAADNEMCKRDGCGRGRKEHGLDWIHAAVKITATVEDAEGAEDPEDGEKGDVAEGEAWMWNSCKLCGKRTERVEMSDGTFLSSFAKFLELTIYSPSFATITPELCEHTREDGPSEDVATAVPVPKRYPAPSLAPGRFNIRRHFEHRGQLLSFSSFPLDTSVFEVKIPRLQIIRTPAEVKKLDTTPLPSSPSPDGSVEDEVTPEERERDELRLEITYWWSALKDHVVKLEDHLAGQTARMKTKRLPSTPDGSDDEGEEPATPKAVDHPTEPSTTSQRTSSEVPVESRPASRLSLPFTGTAPPSPVPKDTPDTFALLQRLRQSFQTTEQSLYKLLTDTPFQSLNDVRRKFRSSADGAKRRLAAWQSKHAPKAKQADGLGEFDSSEYDPAWWSSGHHLMPRSRIVIRERDWGSIIAFTLSSEEYKRELLSMALGRMATTSTAPGTPMETPRPQMSTNPSNLSISSRASNSTSKISVANGKAPSESAAADPDESDEGFVIWNEDDESYSAVITRKEHPKDTAGILGLRDVLRNQRAIETPFPSAPGSGGLSTSGSGTGVATTGSSSSRLSALGNSASKLIRYGIGSAGSTTGSAVAPPSAWAKAELEISLKPAQGELRAVEGGQVVAAGSGEEKLSDILAQVEQHAHDFHDKSSSPLAIPGISEGAMGYATIKSAPSKMVKAPSAVEEADESSMTGSTPSVNPASGTEGLDSLAPSLNLASGRTTPTPDDSSFTPAHSRESTGQTIAPPVPPKDFSPKSAQRELPSTPTQPSRIVLSGSQSVITKDSVSLGTSASTTGSLSSTVASAIRYVLGTPSSSPPHKRHVGLLAMQGSSGAGSVYPPIDERPHLKYDFTLGHKLKFSCTVYYARQFDFLRKRCGIDSSGDGSFISQNDIVRSLERCVGWDAEGGKSKSTFLKTEDDRYIIKTLVNAWNVADLQVLLELGPSYFRYMDMTSSHASVLAKLMGFFTIEVHNLDPKSGASTLKMKADLLIMENIFYTLKMGAGHTFDLKGIAGRKVKRKDPPPAKESADTTEQKQKGERRRVKLLAEKHAAPAVQKPLFDGEWIEGQQKTMIFVEPHAKAILREAIKSDAEFLAKSNIMDYSLLLGIDQSRRQIACGLVDTIGSYTFAKTLEYKAKQGLTGNSGREITVVPPAEYQDRFVNAMEGYFVACPDKWSKSESPGHDCANIDDLPSVF